MKTGIVTAIMIVASAAAASAREPANYYSSPDDLIVGRSSVGLLYAYDTSMKALRKSALAAQASDGGTLSPEHRATFQAKLDRLNAGYKRRFGNLKLLNADGSSLH